ncbi:MAG: acetyl-CoA carboxylase biotin carboxyl carrier protein subunit [Deferribacteraceae bacterium]|jgi:biotin carboxyl carrier protein|nr:acetyl-CoA carboxylase biotin carboxyl carrier protein subunit [Deferribacteraceae bacterium]
MMKLRVKVNGVDFDVEVEHIEDNRQQHLHQTPVYTPPPAATRPTAAAAPTPPAAPTANGLSSPVSGTVLDIKCNVGDKVKPGDPLVIIDSMKMETTVPADREGVVARIGVQKGEAVREGQLLIAFS